MSRFPLGRYTRIYLDAGKTGPFDHAFYFWRNDPEKKDGTRKTYKDGDKVGAANIICQDQANLDILDLRERLAELTEMICKANGLKKA